MAKNNKKTIVTPLGDRVLLKPHKDEAEKRASGIYIPETAQKDTPERGEVLAVGEGKRNESGQLIPLRVKVGDTVMFSKYMGTDTVKVDNEELFIVSESQILAIIK